MWWLYVHENQSFLTFDDLGESQHWHDCQFTLAIRVLQNFGAGIHNQNNVERYQVGAREVLFLIIRFG